MCIRDSVQLEVVSVVFCVPNSANFDLCSAAKSRYRPLLRTRGRPTLRKSQAAVNYTLSKCTRALLRHSVLKIVAGCTIPMNHVDITEVTWKPRDGGWIKSSAALRNPKFPAKKIKTKKHPSLTGRQWLTEHVFKTSETIFFAMKTSETIFFEMA